MPETSAAKIEQKPKRIHSPGVRVGARLEACPGTRQTEPGNARFLV